MINKCRIIVFIVSFLIAAFFCLSRPNEARSGVAGCCQVNDQCVGCQSGCGISNPSCTSAGGSVVFGEVCVNPTGQDSMCVPPNSDAGCCLQPPGICQETSLPDCQPVNAGTIWFDTSCSEVPQCTRQIPTLSEWGIIIMAGVLGLFAVLGIFPMRRGRAVTN
jgi:IPTL-CTERM motif